MPRKPIGERPMTDAERQARHRAARAAGRPAIRYRRAADQRSRTRRWRDAVSDLLALQAEYQAWLDTLPDNLQEGATAELTRVGAQAPPTPFAPRNAEGAALRARVPPMHYPDKPNPALTEGSRLDAKRGSRLDAN